jgi:hypothetical protein
VTCSAQTYLHGKQSSHGGPLLGDGPAQDVALQPTAGGQGTHVTRSNTCLKLPNLMPSPCHPPLQHVSIDVHWLKQRATSGTAGCCTPQCAVLLYADAHIPGGYVLLTAALESAQPAELKFRTSPQEGGQPWGSSHTSLPRHSPDTTSTQFSRRLAEQHVHIHLHR